MSRNPTSAIFFFFHEVHPPMEVFVGKRMLPPWPQECSDYFCRDSSEEKLGRGLPEKVGVGAARQHFHRFSGTELC